MCKFPGQWLLLAVVLAVGGVGARAADAPMAEIVVSMRYLQPAGTSHSHLYLYREDGKLLRQLTDDNTSQDRDPIFAPDGESIVFARRGDKGGTDYWSIEPHGGNLHRLDAAPGWYTDAKNAPAFEHIFNGPPIVREPRPAPTDSRKITTPDGNTEITILPLADTQDFGAPDRWEVSLRTRVGEQPVKVGELAGYSAGFLSRHENEGDPSILREGTLAVAFCFVHLGSTDGDSVVALDLNAWRLVPLSPNYADPIPLPGEAAFLTWTENRYIPYGDGQHTANCSYVEHWDAALKRVRYAKDKAAGVCYGVAMYRPGKTPAVVVMRGSE